MRELFSFCITSRGEMSCGLTFIVFVVLSGCMTFHPRPIEPLRVEAEFRERTLTDPGLHAYVEAVVPSKLSEWPPPTWDLATLTLVAFYYHPDLEVARAAWKVAQAAVVTAAARSNPTITVAPGYTSNAGGGISPWLLNVPLDIPLETAGKRGYRIAQAVHHSEAAQLNIAATAWRVRSRLRTTLLNLYTALQTEALLKRQLAVQEEIVALMKQRLTAGEVSQPTVTLARLAREQTRLAVQDTRKQHAEARVQLAEALGVAVEVLNGAIFDFDIFDHLPPQLPSQEVQRQALLSRPDILAALAEYAATESVLQLEIAKQYPDIHLGPSYELDTGENKWFLGPSVVLPVLNRREGPIAEAKGRRAEAAARFTVVQARVIGEIDRTLAGYEAARQTFTIAEALLSAHQKQLASTHALFNAGETDRLALLSAQLELDVSAQARLDALVTAQRALGLLEDAVQRPLNPLAPLPTPPDMRPGAEEERTQ